MNDNTEDAGVSPLWRVAAQGWMPAVILVVGSATAFATNQWINPEAEGASGKVKANLGSRHEGDDGDPDTPGKDIAYAIARGLDSGEVVELWGSGFLEGQEKIIAHQLIVKGTTPFSDLNVSAIEVENGFLADVATSEGWKETVKPAPAHLKVWYGQEQQSDLVIDVDCMAHMIAGPTAMPSVDIPIEALVHRFEEGGSLMVEIDENLDFVVLLGENGDVQWEVAPALALRFTSSVSDPTAGQRTYTYTLQNLSSEARAFHFREVTSSGYPGGWSGTVSGNSTTSIQVMASESEDVYSQLCQVFTNTSGSNSWINDAVVRVHVPESRVQYMGTHSMTGEFNATLGRNELSLELSAPASKVALYRSDSSGVHLVLVQTGTFLENQAYEFVDEEYADGANEYWFATGIGANYYSTPDGEGVVIEN